MAEAPARWRPLLVRAPSPGKTLVRPCLLPEVKSELKGNFTTSRGPSRKLNASCALGLFGNFFRGGSPTFVLALGGVQLPLPVLQWP